MIHPTADVADNASVADSAQIWHYCQIREGAVIGHDCILGRGSYVGPGVRIGMRTKIQNYVQIHHPAIVGEGVFLGPGAILTNDSRPRSISKQGLPIRAADWEPRGIEIHDGASIGAGVTVLAGVSIGSWAMIGAGAVVTRDVEPYSLMVGNPARKVGWIGFTGVRLEENELGHWVCPETGDKFLEVEGKLKFVDSR